MERYSKKIWGFELRGIAVLLSAALAGIGFIILYNHITNILLPLWVLVFFIHPANLFLEVKSFTAGFNTYISENNTSDYDKQILNKGIIITVRNYLFRILFIHSLVAGFIYALSFTDFYNSDIHSIHAFVSWFAFENSNTFRNGLEYANNLNS